MSRELTFQTMQKHEVKFYADLFTFTEKTLNRKYNCRCNETLSNTFRKYNKISQFSKHESLLRTLKILRGNNRYSED